MYTPLALLDLHALLTARTALLPVTGGVVTGFAFAFFRGRLGRLSFFGNRDSESLMNFSSLGALRFICGTQHPEGVAVERRQFCRSCGCEVAESNTKLLEKQLTRKEIKAMTMSLRRAAMRASHLELPPTINNVEELHRYLDSAEPKVPRMPPPSGSTKEQRVH